MRVTHFSREPLEEFPFCHPNPQQPYLIYVRSLGVVTQLHSSTHVVANSAIRAACGNEYIEPLLQFIQVMPITQAIVTNYFTLKQSIPVSLLYSSVPKFLNRTTRAKVFPAFADSEENLMLYNLMHHNYHLPSIYPTICRNNATCL